MSAYVELQEAEFASEADGYTATRHQREVGTGYFDRIATALNPDSATLALVGSTEAEQFALSHRSNRRCDPRHSTTPTRTTAVPTTARTSRRRHAHLTEPTPTPTRPPSTTPTSRSPGDAR